MLRWMVSLAVWLAVVSFSMAVSAQFTGTEYINGLKLQGHEYMDSSGKVTLQWDLVAEAQAYNIRVIMFDKVPETTYAIGQTSQTQMEILRPRAGHFRFEAQACRYADCHCEPDADSDPCADDLSGWSQSTDPTHASVDGTPMGWWVYWKTPPPVVLPPF